VLGDLAPRGARTVSPSPTGNLHVGNVRSALLIGFSLWHYGGHVRARVEDPTQVATSRSHTRPSYSPTWLGLRWDEGPLGRAVPHIQTERGDIHVTWSRSYCGPGWPTAAIARGRRSKLEAARHGAASGDGPAATSESAIAELDAMSVPSVVRMRVPDADIAFDDLVRGPVRFAAAHVPDYVIVRGNGEPLYTLVNPVDDSLMRITHVLRGEDLLPSTPRQIVLYDALKQIGLGSGRTPAFGHLPTVLGEGNRRLSKRDKGSGLAIPQKAICPRGC
jgi:glutamyl-tRNA synthetase